MQKQVQGTLEYCWLGIQQENGGPRKQHAEVHLADSCSQGQQKEEEDYQGR